MYLVSLSTPTIKSKTPSSPTWTTSKTYWSPLTVHSSHFRTQLEGTYNLDHTTALQEYLAASWYTRMKLELLTVTGPWVICLFSLSPHLAYFSIYQTKGSCLRAFACVVFLYLDSSSSSCSWGWLLTFQVRKKITQWSFQRGLLAKLILSLELCYILSSRFPSQPLLQSDFFFLISVLLCVVCLLSLLSRFHWSRNIPVLI